MIDNTSQCHPIVCTTIKVLHILIKKRSDYPEYSTYARHIGNLL